MGNAILTEAEIEDLILGIVNAKEEKYWIKSFVRGRPNQLFDTMIEVATLEENGGGDF